MKCQKCNGDMMGCNGPPYCPTCGRLKGMQGPERHLVGESRSDRRQGAVEEAEPGRRGVGEIVELAELWRHIDRKIEEAHARMADEIDGQKDGPYDHWSGKAAALIDLKIWLSDMTEKRSDLSNVQAMASADTQTPTTPENDQ